MTPIVIASLTVIAIVIGLVVIKEFCNFLREMDRQKD